MRLGGLTLDRETDDKMLIREYIHPQYPMYAEDHAGPIPDGSIKVRWKRQGWLPLELDSTKLVEHREHHYRRLECAYKAEDIHLWMPFLDKFQEILKKREATA